jgi:hypothetical protein
VKLIRLVIKPVPDSGKMPSSLLDSSTNPALKSCF